MEGQGSGMGETRWQSLKCHAEEVCSPSRRHQEKSVDSGGNEE